MVANIYSIYNLFNTAINDQIDNETLKTNLSKLMKILIPFVPHLAYECLEQLGAKDTNTWPISDLALKTEEKIKIAIQINGRTKEIIEVKKDLEEEDIINECKKIKKIDDQLKLTKIQKTIFVKNRIINYLTK
mgnify:FL=1